MIEAKLIRATVSSRAKDPERFRGKLRKYLRDDKERTALDSVEKVFERVGDLAGVRITTYVEKDRIRVVEELKVLFVAGSNEGEVPIVEKDAPDKLYRATHCQAAIRSEELVGTYANLKDVTCEIQVCSLLAHVYNEIEHDIRYKKLTGEISKKEHALLDALGMLTASGDVLIETVIEAQERRQSETQGEFEDEYDFVTRMRPKFPDAGQFKEHAYQLFEELLEFGLDSPEKIQEALMGGDYQARSSSLVANLGAYCNNECPQVVKVEPDTSDRLLVLLFDKYAPQIEQRHPAGRGKGRPSRLRSLAKRFLLLQAAEHPEVGSQ